MAQLRRFCWTALGVAATMSALTAFAAERITAYHSDLAVAADGTVEVVESIEVVAEGLRIRRGIYRDFPTDYRDRLGNRVRVAFDVLGAQRDGAPEPYRIQRQANGIRVYLGRENVLLDPGVYRYELRYRTRRVVGFFDDHDEIYWNVTGNGWDMLIEKASASVTLPPTVSADDVSVSGFTGRTGSTAKNYTTQWLSDGSMRIDTTGILGPREGLTLVATWPKGHVTAPTMLDDAVFLLRQNPGLLIASASLAAAFFYLFFAWRKVGRDLPPGVRFPQYKPPQDYSPSSLRFIAKMHYDERATSAAILNLAVKRFVKISSRLGVFTLERTDKARDDTLAEGESTLLASLFSKGKSLKLKNDNHAIISRAMDAHHATLRRFHLKREFVLNGGFLAPAVMIVGLGLLAVALMGELTVATIAVFCVAGLLILLFSRLLKAPTVLGRKLLDKVDGFRMFLEVAEKDELNFRNPPERTPELFEAYLPYALALDVEQAWAAQFVEVLARSLQGDGGPVESDWFGGMSRSSNPLRIATQLGGSFDSAISSAASAPGSSSGGGGFSGGGGGGGGGGGW